MNSIRLWSDLAILNSSITIEFLCAQLCQKTVTSITAKENYFILTQWLQRRYKLQEIQKHMNSALIEKQQNISSVSYKAYITQLGN